MLAVVNGLLEAEEVINQARINKERRTTVAVRSNTLQQNLGLLRDTMRDLRVPRWGYRIKVIDLWGRGLAINFDPGELGVQVILILHKRTVNRLTLLVHD